MAPPSKYTRAIHEQIIAHLRTGLFRENAAALVGVHPDTIGNWCRRGRQELADVEERQEAGDTSARVGRFGRFLVDVLAVEAQVEAQLVGVVLKIAAEGTSEDAKLRACDWYLARRHNLRYGRGALRVDIARGDSDEYDGTTEEADSLELLTHLSRYDRSRKAPTQ